LIAAITSFKIIYYFVYLYLPHEIIKVCKLFVVTSDVILLSTIFTHAMKTIFIPTIWAKEPIIINSLNLTTFWRK